MRGPHMGLTLALVAGCSGGGITGIWMMELPFMSTDTQTCNEQVDHNFTGAYVPEDTGMGAEWTETTTVKSSDKLQFVQIIEADKDNAVLIAGNKAYPGTRDNDQWTFEWTTESENIDDKLHQSGYEYTSDLRSTSTIQLTLTIDGDSGTGTWSEDSQNDDYWTESDTWSEELSQGDVGPTGQIPSYRYLVHDIDGGPTGVPQKNDWETADCSGDCTLRVIEECTGSYDVTVTRTGYQQEDAYQNVGNAGQGYGGTP